MRTSQREHQLILELLSDFADQENYDLASEVIHSSINLLRDRAARLDVKLLNKAVKELRYAFKVFAPYRHLRKVSAFGSARTGEDSAEYRMALDFGRKIRERGFMVLTGAGSGIMEAVQKGAGRDGGFGLNIRLPMEQEANSTLKGDPKLITFKYFFTRKLMFVKETSAIVCFPGGFGTMDETLEALTLMQTGKSYVIPIVLVQSPEDDYWQSWDGFVRRHMVDRGKISREDTLLYRITESVDAACAEIASFYRVYHSMRYVGTSTVFRLNHPISQDLVHRLTEQFSDVLDDGEFVQRAGPLPEENGDAELASLPRLVFPFNSRSMGRLREIVDRINQDE
jgi:uncharacterized protein (TIGR00730 family)